MIEEKEFENHLLTFERKNWDRLFRLLPEIEKATVFGELKGGSELNDGSIQMPFWSRSKIADDFLVVFHSINLSVIFDWASWKEGKNILNQKDVDLNKLDTLTLCKLLTTIVRADRFNDGYLISCFENGIVPKIIKAIKLK